MFQGWVERWPQDWDMNGLYSQATPTVVDSFATLSQTILKAPFFMDVLATIPRFFYPLNDPAGVSQCVDISGNYPYAQLQNSAYGPGSVTFGSSITSTSGGLTGGISGYGGPVTTFNNNALLNTATQPGTSIDLSTAGIHGTAGIGWTRMIAFRCPAVQVETMEIWAWTQAQWGVLAGAVNLQAAINISNNGATHPGNLVFSYTTTAVEIDTPLTTASVCDGNWHLLFVSVDGTGNWLYWNLDGVLGSASLSGAPYALQSSFSDTLGLIKYAGNQQSFNGYIGDMATVAEWPNQLYNNATWQATVNQLYTCWRNAYNGEASDARFKRILGWAGYKGRTSIGAGASAMGPATDLIPSNSLGGNLVTSGTDALTALNNVVITENGNHFVDANGVLVFQPRASRYQPFIAAATFGENVAGGEIPYEDVAFDFDTTQVANDVQITQNFTQQLFLSEGASGNPVNSTSQAQYGVRTMQRTVNNTNPQECIDASNFYLYRYGQSDLRVRKIMVHVSALYQSVPGAWPACLGLELGSMVTVKRRPPGWANAPGGSAIISWNGFVESISWDMAPAEAVLTMELSPADRYQFWEWPQLHGTLNAGVSSGATAILINPLPDSATNAAYFSFYNGMSICLDPGLATQETVTVTSVPHGSAGYANATVNVAALTYNHTANAVWEDATAGISGVSTTPGYFDSSAVVGVTTRWAY